MLRKTKGFHGSIGLGNIDLNRLVLFYLLICHLEITSFYFSIVSHNCKIIYHGIVNFLFIF